MQMHSQPDPNSVHCSWVQIAAIIVTEAEFFFLTELERCKQWCRTDAG